MTDMYFNQILVMNFIYSETKFYYFKISQVHLIGIMLMLIIGVTAATAWA